MSRGPASTSQTTSLVDRGRFKTTLQQPRLTAASCRKGRVPRGDRVELQRARASNGERRFVREARLLEAGPAHGPLDSAVAATATAKKATYRADRARGDRPDD